MGDDDGWTGLVAVDEVTLLPSPCPALPALNHPSLGPAGRYGTEGDPVSVVEMHFSNYDMLSDSLTIQSVQATAQQHPRHL